MKSLSDEYIDSTTEQEMSEILQNVKKMLKSSKYKGMSFQECVAESALKHMYDNYGTKGKPNLSKPIVNPISPNTSVKPSVKDSKPIVNSDTRNTSVNPSKTNLKPPTEVNKSYNDEVPPVVGKVPRSIPNAPVYIEKPAEPVPIKNLTGVVDMKRFRFRATDTVAEMFVKINYIKSILKNKSVSQRQEILKYYDIPIAFERRSNQMYMYGSKNLKNRKYKFYVGRYLKF